MRAAEFEWLEPALRDAFPALELLGKEVFIVGGAIRDLLLGLRPIDVDLVAPSIRPLAEDFARKVRSRVVELGRDPLAAYRVTARGRIYDFTDQIGATIEEDLGRRDLTLNAIAVDRRAEAIVDPLGGAPDIARRLVRIISARNLDEDPLRILRAVRFAAGLRFEVDAQTMGELQSRAATILQSAPERVTYEMNLILGGPGREQGARLLRESGIDLSVLGAPLAGERIAALRKLRGEGSLAAWAILLAGRSNAEIAAFAERWRWSVSARRTVIRAVSLMKKLEAGEGRSDGDLAVLMFDAGEGAARVAEAALAALGGGRTAARLAAIAGRDRGAVFAPIPLLGGSEIGELAGRKPGPAIGRLKRALVEAQLRGEVSTRQDAEALIRRLT